MLPPWRLAQAEIAGIDRALLVTKGVDRVEPRCLHRRPESKDEAESDGNREPDRDGPHRH